MAKKAPFRKALANASASMGVRNIDVRKMKVADDATVAQLKAKLGIKSDTATVGAAAPLAAAKVAKPGKERWAVKTGTDADAGKVQQTIIPATIEELVQVVRPAGMKDVTKLNPAYDKKRAAPTEDTIFRIPCQITAIKIEVDGDFHLVIQGASGTQMIAEVPNPDPNFVDPSSPFAANIARARAAVEKKFQKTIAATSFVPMPTPTGKVMMVPVASASGTSSAALDVTVGKPTNAAGQDLALKLAVKPTKATITGVGFFDKVHGQDGVAPTGIELHPVLDVQFN